MMDMDANDRLPRPLNDREARMMGKLLESEFPGSKELARQALALEGKELDDNGSLALFPSGEATPAAVEKRIPVEAEFSDEDGTTAHVLLHVVRGYLAELEIYREDSGRLLRPPDADDLRVAGSS